jgi:hypothetical protein
VTAYSEEPPVIKAILDRSALESYARGHVHVGELVNEITTEENHYVGIPAIALLDAHVRVLGNKHARALLDVLAALPGTSVLALDAKSAAAVAENVVLTGGDLSRAQSIWAAREHAAHYFTTEPEQSVGLVPDQILVIPAKDA